MTRSEVFALAFLAVGIRFSGDKRERLWDKLYQEFHKHDPKNKEVK